MIELNDLQFRYGQHTIIDCPAAGFETGLVHGIVGLNGAGKTTFFNLLARYLRPAEGQILMDGSPLSADDVGFLETSNYYYSNITGGEYLRIFPATNKQFRLDIMNSMFRLPLHELASSYSTGMKKKLALLAILQQDKPVYILDEPFNGLDMETNQVLELILHNLREKKKTVFVSSHILAPLLHCCDRIHILEQGRFQKTYERDAFTQIASELFEQFNQKAGLTIRSGM